jgi:hypothetical protein
MIRMGTAGLSSLLSLTLALLYSAHVHFASPFVLTRSATLEGVLVLTAVTGLVQIRTIHSDRTSVPLAGLAGYLLVHRRRTVHGRNCDFSGSLRWGLD